MATILIHNGRVIDGKGNPWFRADVLIHGGLIARIGRQIDDIDGDPPDQVIDATGMCVCPGFIDIHTHPDLSLFYKEVQDYKLRQGITTEVSGNCGLTAAPLEPETGEVLRQYLAFLTPPSGVTWDWRTFGDYLDAVRSSGTPTNIAPLVGHGTVRIAVMGFDLRLLPLGRWGV